MWAQHVRVRCKQIEESVPFRCIPSRTGRVARRRLINPVAVGAARSGRRRRRRDEQQAQAPRAAGASVARGEAAPSATTPSPSLPTICGESILKRAITLRNRKVFVQNTGKPELGRPTQYKKRNKVDLHRKEPVHNVSWMQTPACAKVALEHYNGLNEDEHELVKAVDSVSFFFNGVWMHANFLVKLKGATRGPELVPKFFAELYVGPDGVDRMSCISCVKIDPGNREETPVRGCEACRNDRIFHPAAGGHRGDRKSEC